jgi:hypothetical protein
MPEPREVVPEDDTPDARLDRLLHDFDVANDAHPCRRPTAHLGRLAEPGDGHRRDESAPGADSATFRTDAHH